MKLDRLPSTIMPPPAVILTFWTFGLISISQAQVHRWSILVKIF